MHKLGSYVDANAFQVSDEIDGPAIQRTRCLALDDLATAQHTSFFVICDYLPDCFCSFVICSVIR